MLLSYYNRFVKTNPFIKILKNSWAKFKKTYTEYETDYFNTVIQKVINCKDPKLGYVEYRCMKCGNGFHKVAFSCKSRFCISCSRTSSMDFIDEMMTKLHPGVIYRHLILTIPKELRDFFYKNKDSKQLYNLFMRTGSDFVNDVFRKVTGIPDLETGCAIVLHTSGRSGTYNPHLHIIVMAGGIDPCNGKWVNLPYFKYENYLPKKWKWHLLNMVKKHDSSNETLSLINALWKKQKKGYVNNFKKGDVPKKSTYLVKYLAKYISRPSISVSSILKCDMDNENVTYKYKDHKTKINVTTTCSFIEFIKRLAQQILPKCFHRIKYYGLQHPSGYKRRFKEITEGLKKIGAVQGSDSFLAYATGDWKWDRDPRKCEFCGEGFGSIENLVKKKWCDI